MPGIAIHSLAVFRILFGMLMAAAMVRFLAHGWVDELFLKPGYHFPYPGLEWIRPWPAVWMHVHVMLVAVCAVGMALGFRYRLCAVLFFAGFTYLELIDRTAYLNHYYLVSLVSGLLVFMPAHWAWSVDARRRSGLRVETIPAWTVGLLRFQFAIVYVFAGIAKLNGDWLLAAQPLRIWLAARSDLPLVGPWLEKPWVAMAAAWTGAVYDLTIPFLLMMRRTRSCAFGAVIAFHVATGVLFPSIGMFPWIMIAGSTLFFPPDWPMRVWKRSGPVVQAVVPPMPRWGRWLIGVYLAWQIAVPMRGLFMDGPSAWSGNGFNWAWKVMIVEKAGSVSFIARDPFDGRRWQIDVRDYLTPRQVTLMAQDPHLVRDFARFLGGELRRLHGREVEVHAEAYASLNGRPSQPIIDPAVNLAGEPVEHWIVPMLPDTRAQSTGSIVSQWVRSWLSSSERR